MLDSCVLPELTAPEHPAAPGPAAMSVEAAMTVEALYLETTARTQWGEGDRREGLCSYGESSNEAEAVGAARAPGGGPRRRCSPSPAGWHRAELGRGAPTLGDTTLMSSLRKRNLPTSSWNLLPQLFMHVSSTWGEVGCRDPGEGQRRQPRSTGCL